MNCLKIMCCHLQEVLKYKCGVKYFLTEGNELEISRPNKRKEVYVYIYIYITKKNLGHI